MLTVRDAHLSHVLIAAVACLSRQYTPRMDALVYEAHRDSLGAAAVAREPASAHTPVLFVSCLSNYLSTGAGTWFLC